ncbi:hypothetical protein LCGC14_2988970, partial [marine sediment metagenome]
MFRRDVCWICLAAAAVAGLGVEPTQADPSTSDT